MAELSIPGFLTAPPFGEDDLEGTILGLYRDLAAAHRQAEENLQLAENYIRETTRETHQTIAAMASIRFEFDRLMHRIRPMLETKGNMEICGVLDLFSREWSAVLARHAVELRDLTGEEFTDAIAEVVEICASFEDPNVRDPVVSNTLSPLVLYKGRIAMKSVIEKAVPPLQQADSEEKL